MVDTQNCAVFNWIDDVPPWKTVALRPAERSIFALCHPLGRSIETLSLNSPPPPAVNGPPKLKELEQEYFVREA